MAGAVKRDAQRTTKIISEGKGNAILSGALLVGVGIDKSATQGVRAVAFGGGLYKQKDAIAAIEENCYQMQASCIAEGFEAVESYVKAVTSAFLYSKRQEGILKNKNRKTIATRIGDKLEKENTPQYFDQAVGVLASRNCERLFKILFKEVSTLKQAIEAHPYPILAIHEAVEFIRHSKSHANGRVNADRFEELSKTAAAIVKSLIHSSIIHSDKRILPNQKEASDLLAREAEYCQIIYEAVSSDLNMKIDHKPS